MCSNGGNNYFAVLGLTVSAGRALIAGFGAGDGSRER